MPAASTKISIWALLASFFLAIHVVKPDDQQLRTALTSFIISLTNNSGGSPNPWNLTTSGSNPCGGRWQGVTCDNKNNLKGVALDGLKLSGMFDPSPLCNITSIAATLTVVSLNDNILQGQNLENIANCTQLTRLFLGGNRLSGTLPQAFSELKNLKRLDISSNNFSGSLPDFSKISGLVQFSAEDNQLSGALPDFDFFNLDTFNVSSNNFSGPIPSGGDRFPASSFANNPYLCGNPLPSGCQPAPESSSSDDSKAGNRKDKILMLSGYIILALTVFLLIIRCLCKTREKAAGQVDKDAKFASVEDEEEGDDGMTKSSYTTSSYKVTPLEKSEISSAPVDNSNYSSSLVVLTSPEVNGIKFENLLKSPAELLGRGAHGNVYKVLSEELGMTVVVKRIKDWAISSDDFKQRMRRLDRVQHPNVLSALAFYFSKQEKLLVYEYQKTGSLLKLLHGSRAGAGAEQTFDWSTRLDIAASIADGLSFMHQELGEDGIAHGNLKSSNILLSKNLEPFISEYGLTLDSSDPSFAHRMNASPGKGENQAIFKADVYAFGIILLELLTGKLAQNDATGLDLASWVVSVVKEEWTVEVFDKTLIREGASEERMVNLLQIAIKCVNPSPEARPGMNELSQMLTTLKEEEEKSIDDVSGITSASIFDRV